MVKSTPSHEEDAGALVVVVVVVLVTGSSSHVWPASVDELVELLAEVVV